MYDNDCDINTLTIQNERSPEEVNNTLNQIIKYLHANEANMYGNLSLIRQEINDTIDDLHTFKQHFGYNGELAHKYVYLITRLEEQIHALDTFHTLKEV